MSDMNNSSKQPFIVLNQYEKIKQGDAYQSENDLERELIADLQAQGYEYRRDLNTPAKLLDNLRTHIQALNQVSFSNTEWQRFLNEYLNHPSATPIDQSRKIHHDSIYDFVFDNGRIKNIALLDKKNLENNKLQVIHQFEQSGSHANRYDVTLLVNGLPLVQIELKRRGVAIREAFNQIHRYSKESFNGESSLFKYLQIFIISNGTDTRYFANTTQRNKNSFDFTMQWATADNAPIRDLKDFSATFLQKNTLLNVLVNYCVFDVNETLLIMRPYQIAATERILQQIRESHAAQHWSTTESGGYIWHTTGSGKTLTSFKAAQLATQLPFIDKVFFVVDRKDLDYQTMKEYQRFSPDSVNGSDSTAGLKRNLEKNDNKIIVTTIQKLNHLLKAEAHLPVYKKQVVFIFDECHRSQFGEAQRNLKNRFTQFYQFGFTGTPIFSENALGTETTEKVFGKILHAYVITDAIRDEKVLKFKVDYHAVHPKFKEIEGEMDAEKQSALDGRLLLHPERIRSIALYILENFAQKTHRLYGQRGFNAMFAVESVAAAKCYYRMFQELQGERPKPLKIATIFSFAANEAQDALGHIGDEVLETSALDSSSKEFLEGAINDYNREFSTHFSLDAQGFQNYYRDLSQRVKNQEIDLLIVVGMFLTGFDAPRMNTLFVDKNLRYHGLIQAFSRTNRIFNGSKAFGNIVCFRDLQKATTDALKLFAHAESATAESLAHCVLERSYDECMWGYKDAFSGQRKRGFQDIITELQERFPEPDAIIKEQDKKDFARLFGEYLRMENVLQNHDEFKILKKMQHINREDGAAVAEFKKQHHLDDAAWEKMQALKLPSERARQDYCSIYHGILEWQRRQQQGHPQHPAAAAWDDIVFEVDLLQSQEINLDYLLALIFEKKQQQENQSHSEKEIRAIIRASMAHRAKESLLMDFMELHQTFPNVQAWREAFFQFAQERQKQKAEDLIERENLNAEATKRYLMNSLKRQYASEWGTALNETMPQISPLHAEYLSRKKSIYAQLSAFVEQFKGIGGRL